MTDMIYAGVGSRQTPVNICEAMTTLAYQMSQSGWHLRSGYAIGADQAFGLGACQHSDETGIRDNFTMYLPWAGYNGAPTRDPQFISIDKIEYNFEELYLLAKNHHPNWINLTDPVKLLMLRNAAIVAGIDARTPANLLICWTPQAKAGGGTGHAIRIANTLKIPVFDLASDYDQRAVVDYINASEAARKFTEEDDQLWAEARLEANGMSNR